MTRPIARWSMVVGGAIAVALGLASVTVAQSASAQLSGTVIDETGASVPGVAVTVINTATTLQRKGVTSPAGNFVFAQLPPGLYSLSAEMTGFNTAEIRDLTLNVGDQLVMTLQLQIAKLGDTVTVVADAPRISTSPSVATVIDRSLVENLPMNGRTFQTLIELAPGTVLVKATATAPGQFSVNGQRTDTNYFTVDGVSANIGIGLGTISGTYGAGHQAGFSAQGGLNNLVSVDAMQEFKIQTSSYAPEFGRSPGGQISIVSRSGTNVLHGTLFDYVRSDKLDANNWFANANNQPKPPAKQHDFGGVLGGPLVPNRTFYFVSYEGLRLRQPQVAVKEVPSLSLRAQVAPAMKQILDAFPLPTGPDFGNGLAQYAASYANRSALDATSIRIDHSVNDRLMLFGRYNGAPSYVEARAAPSQNPVSNIFTNIINTHTVTVGATWLASPRFTNDARANYSHYVGRSHFTMDDFGGAIPPPDSIFPAFVTPKNSQLSAGLRYSTSPGFQYGALADHLQRQFNVTNTTALSLGVHQIKLGLDFRRLTPIVRPLELTQQINVNTLAQAQTSVITAFMLKFSGTSATFDNLSVFAQDTWTVSPKITLTYGLRWERNPPPSFPPDKQPFVVDHFENIAAWTVEPLGTPLWTTTNANFAPRAGIAYVLSARPGRELVMRSGGGIFYDLGTGQATAPFGSEPFTTTKVLTNVPFPLTPDLQEPRVAAPPYGVVLFDPHLKLPYTWEWNASFEQALGASQTMTAAYVGAAGRRLVHRRNFTGLAVQNPMFSSAALLVGDATSDYRALQLSFRRRLSRGVQALVSYTLAKSTDDASSDLNDAFLQRAPSAFDVRHAFGAAATYELPSPPRWARALGGWSIDTTVHAQSATPFTVSAGIVNINAVSYFLRPNLVDGQPLYLEDRTAPGGRRLNPAAFATPPAGTNGNHVRNSLRGFPLFQADMALRRQIRVTDRVALQLRAEAFNVLNHPNFGDPVATLASGLFGRATTMFNTAAGGGGFSGGLSPLYQIGGPRSIQLAAKVLF